MRQATFEIMLMHAAHEEAMYISESREIYIRTYDQFTFNAPNKNGHGR